jgi:carbamate kinase
VRSVIATGGNALLRQRAEANVERWHVSQAANVSAPLAPSRHLANYHGYGTQLDRPKIRACVEFTPATGRPAATGALSDASEVLAGRAGTTVCPGTTNEVTRMAS